MNRNLCYYLRWTLILVIPVFAISCADNDKKEAVEPYISLGRAAVIKPDYSGIVIPRNIAPLNFVVTEKGKKYHVKIRSEKGEAIELFSGSGKIIIPQKPWQRLISLNKGHELTIDIYVKGQDGRWNRYDSIINQISPDEIDGYIVYRKIHPTHRHKFGRIAIFCRDLSNYDERLVLDNSYFGQGCLNCHAFCKNNPDKMVLGIRSYQKYGMSTLLIEDDKVSNLDVKFGYTSWHPSGKLISYSVNKLPMAYHTVRNKVRETIDVKSLIAYYQLGTRAAQTTENLSKKERLETWPAWSADGKYLYFCNAPMLWPEESENPVEAFKYYRQVRYDLVRISYDIEQDRWGQLETVLSAEDTNMSVSIPRTSPNGRWLSFCMSNYGYFPSWNRSSDIYLMDLKNDAYNFRKFEGSSDESEGWQSWSSNSKWLAYSSKRDYGVFTKTYFSHIDENGKASKPFVMPQKDPEYYDSCLETYTVPELVTAPLKITGEKLGRAVRGSGKVAIEMPITMATPEVEVDKQQLWYDDHRE